MKAKKVPYLLEFERGGDIKSKVGLGVMKRVKEWLSQFLWSREWKLNDSHKIDVYRDFIVTRNSYEKEIPDFIKFGKCNGSFIWNNGNLQDLKGCPDTVGGDFYVSDNKIQSLTGSPKEVGGDYFIKNNPGNFTKEDIQSVCNVKGKIRV